jgi:hypothetical protein
VELKIGKIRHDRPLPDGFGVESKYPFSKMKHGDSFDVKVPPGRTPKQTQKIINKAISDWKRKNKSGALFPTRQSEDKLSVIVWRMDVKRGRRAGTRKVRRRRARAK